jgi:Tol biopolymer transport system component
MPVYTPDGKWLLVGPRSGRAGTLWRISVEGGKAVPVVTEVANARAKWSIDGKELFFQRDGNFWALSVEEDAEVPVTDFEGRSGRLGQDLATDGQYLYFYWIETRGDIWVMDVVRE